MRAGIVSPVASLNPRFCQPWEYDTGIDAIVALVVRLRPCPHPPRC